MPKSPPTHRNPRFAKHTPPREETRPTAAGRGYDADWQRLRAKYLSEHPTCERCSYYSIVKSANEVHHKRPISKGGRRLDESNLEALCKSCHSRITASERGGGG